MIHTSKIYTANIKSIHTGIFYCYETYTGIILIDCPKNNLNHYGNYDQYIEHSSIFISLGFFIILLMIFSPFYFLVSNQKLSIENLPKLYKYFLEYMRT